MRSGRLDLRSLHTGPALAVLLSAVAIGGIAASAFLVWSARRDRSVELGRLADVVGPHRVTRARLTGGFLYTACKAKPNELVAMAGWLDSSVTQLSRQ